MRCSVREARILPQLSLKTRALPAKTRRPPGVDCISPSDHRLSGKRRSTLFGYVPSGSSGRGIKAGKRALCGEMSPSGDQNEPKGLREGRIAALLPRTLGPGVNEAALLPSRSDPWPRLACQCGCICPTTERVSRGCAWCMVFVHLFRNTPTRATPKGRFGEGPE
jgi:hypothetical protein